MRKLMLSIIVASCLPAFAEELGTVTITNKEGRVYADAQVVRVTPAEIICLFKEGGGGMFRLADLPADLQKRFGYDPKAAKAEDQRVADIKKAEAERIRSVKESKEQAARIQAFRDQTYASRVVVHAQAIYRVPGGVLMDGLNDENNLYFARAGFSGIPVFNGNFVLVGSAVAERMTMTDRLTLVIYPAGETSFKQPDGVVKTVPKFTAVLP